MKAYTVTEDQLNSLGALQLSATFCFSLASILATFWIGVRQDVAFNGPSNDAGRQWWEGLATGAGFGALLLLILGGILMWRGRTTVSKIKRDTIHD